MLQHVTTHKGYIVNIHTDDDPMNPRTEWDNLGTMACFHRRYSLGDTNHGLDIEEVRAIANDNGYLSLPLYLYDHGGLTMNTTGFHCPWDSGMVGIIFISKDRVREEYSYKRISAKLREQVLNMLRSEVETYDDYIRGNVYGYVIENRDGEHVDSCWGFYGPGDFYSKTGYMWDEIESAIDYDIEATAATAELGAA